MPELPEVEAARRQLSRWVAGQQLLDVALPDPATVRTHLSTHPSDAHPRGAALLTSAVGSPLGEPTRHGKRLGIPVGEGGFLGHLGMSGRWVRAAEPPRHARVGLRAPDWVWLVAPRRFACLTPASHLDTALTTGLGPDALHITGAELARACATTRRAVKVALLDQSLVAGLGNIHVAEALWRARVSPLTPCASLDPAVWDRVADAVRAQLATTLADATLEGGLAYLSEGAANPFSVYGRPGAPCPRCQEPVARFSQSGRTTWWCPSCQA